VSTLVFGGLPRRVFEAVENSRCEFYYSDEIESETRRVLRDKFGWDDDRLDRYLRTLWSLGERATPRRRVEVVKEDPDDNRILECALAAGADIVVSGQWPPVRADRVRGNRDSHSTGILKDSALSRDPSTAHADS